MVISPFTEIGIAINGTLKYTGIFTTAKEVCSKDSCFVRILAELFCTTKLNKLNFNRALCFPLLLILETFRKPFFTNEDYRLIYNNKHSGHNN